MALYYLNTRVTPVVFYTDNGTLRNVLRFLGDSEYVRITKLIGKHEITNRLLFARKGKASAGLTCLHDFLPPRIHLKALSDARVITKEFFLETDSGIKAYTHHHTDLIVELTNPAERLPDLLESFRVPIRVCPALLTTPGVMYNVIPRTGSFFEYGYFKHITEWLNQPSYEKPLKRLRAKPEKN